MAFKSIHTAVGLALMASAEGAGTQIRLTHMAVGDGNGNPTTPNTSQTQLVRERYRNTVNRVYQDPSVSNMFTAELIIPATAGGFVMREIGVFDSNGNLFIVGNLPDTYKPNESEGAFSDTVVRVAFMVTNDAIITLQIDPNVVVATQSWIVNNIKPATLFPGGTTNQILRKKSNADGDTEWADPTIANVVVDVIEELQTLSTSQTTVTWASVTNTGLAVYIEGIRIPENNTVDGWQVDLSNPNTHIILGKSYPSGTRILGVQNEPLGSIPYPLEASKNLSDVPDKGIARTNLDVYSKSESDAAGQPGAVIAFARNTAPTGWLKANGAAVSRTAYARLFAAIGTTFGAGDGFNTFNLPDLRGEFVRGWADGQNSDAGRVFGSSQAQQVQRHKHAGIGEAYTNPLWPFGMTDAKNKTGMAGGTDSDNYYYYTNDGSDIDNAMNPAGVVGNETRPRNVALLYCIKF